MIPYSVTLLCAQAGPASAIAVASATPSFVFMAVSKQYIDVLIDFYGDPDESGMPTGIGKTARVACYDIAGSRCRCGAAAREPATATAIAAPAIGTRNAR
ncbi:hypothetical protein BCCH1_04410 [Burkholderia contaminans]|uniref:Uncharacterized protein n=1 Tax=Burkholderia contaminans TaxID=488447 RepID=A0A286P5F5_9BURK|nr:hypothetical protein BCCH1_04410 [Burkholderia contaminans]GLZ72892.1 hypothetical protein Bcon01_59370 [Burkholderia contaminans]